MSALDCRGRGLGETIGALIAGFNALAPGARLEATVDALPAGLRIALLEAGLRCRPRQSEPGWSLTLTRGLSPAQGSVTGLHHIVAGEDGSLWSCERGARVARFDAATGAIAAVAPVARRASHLALHEERDLLFLADSEAGEVLALDAQSLVLRDRFASPGGPQIPLVSPDGIICQTGSATGTVTLAWPERDGYRAETLPIGACPHDPLLAPDGAHVFVPCMGSSELVKLRLADGTIRGRVSVGDGPAHLAADPRQGRIYVAGSWSGTVTCLSQEGEILCSAPSGGWAHAIAVAPEDGSVWVANFLDDSIAVLDGDRLEPLALLDSEPYPHGLDVTPDGSFVVATGFASDHARIFDVRSRRLAVRVDVGRGGSHTAFAGGQAFIACSVADHLAAVDLESRRVTGRISLPA